MTVRYVRLLFHSARPSSTVDRETFSLLLTAKVIDSSSIILTVVTKDVQNNIPLLMASLGISLTHFEALD